MSWPASLQQCFNSGSWNEQPQDVAIRNEPDTGPTKSRQRYTNPERTIQGTIWLRDEADWITFRDFYDVSLAGGTLPFDFEHPITKVLTSYVFQGPYRVGDLQGQIYPVSMTWKEQP